MTQACLPNHMQKRSKLFQLLVKHRMCHPDILFADVSFDEAQILKFPDRQEMQSLFSGEHWKSPQIEIVTGDVIFAVETLSDFYRNHIVGHVLEVCNAGNRHSFGIPKPNYKLRILGYFGKDNWKFGDLMTLDTREVYMPYPLRLEWDDETARPGYIEPPPISPEMKAANERFYASLSERFQTKSQTQPNKNGIILRKKDSGRNE